ncbi:MAG: hypothetical protein C5B54_08830, partial [Acidobacteria bacterium]
MESVQPPPDPLLHKEGGAVGDHFKKSYYAGIFLVAAATLLLEVALTKIFSVIHFHYFAFLIISTALFGYGFSGILLSISKRLENMSKPRLMFVACFLFSISIVAAYGMIISIPLRMGEMFSNFTQAAYLLIVYLLLAVPFFFSGLVIGVLLSYYPDRISRLYFSDLTGAGLGCFAIVVAVPLLGGSGTILAAALIVCLATLAFIPNKKMIVLPLLWSIVLIALLPNADEIFPTTKHSEKRYFDESLENGKAEYTGWSPASRIDVVKMGHDVSVIWIDGGTNQSFMRELGPEDTLAREDAYVWKTVEIPYAFMQHPKVMIIGPGGGVEVASALSYEPVSLTAVELDPLITKIVLGKYSDFIGGIYTRPGVKLINEEGRSFIRRSNEKYDIIQQKNNSHPMAVASGALNLSETYLLTKEAFNEYLDHLNRSGFVTIERQGGIRLLNMAIEVLKERGVKNYWDHLVLIEDSVINQIFLMKNGTFSEEELDYIYEYARMRHKKVLYSPRIYGAKNSIFAALMNDEQREQIIRDAPFELEAPTDDKPFMEHFFRLRAVFSPALKARLEDPFWDKASLTGFVTGEPIYSDLSLYVILGEAILLSSVFIVLPLWKRKRSGVAIQGTARLLLYFFCLGLGFIFVEIALIQKYILFIGYPVYSVAAIIFSLLIAAGAGSFFTNRFMERPIKILRFAVIAIVLLILEQVFVVPYLFHSFLSVSLPARIALSILFLAPAGFFMGMPFPIGLSWTSKHFQGFTPWAWGMNGYATVIGSVLAVVLALQF